VEFLEWLDSLPVERVTGVEAGSLGQVRQVPLNPCRESRREHTIARPGEKSPRANIGSGKAGRSLRIGAAAISGKPKDMLSP
jgi:hypothetical protein